MDDTSKKRPEVLVPEYMRKDSGATKGDFGPDDTDFFGENGELSDEEVDTISLETFSARALLRSILLAIIRSHPNVYQVTDERRLDYVLPALVEAKWNPDFPADPGRPPSVKSREIVAEIAREYLSDLFEKELKKKGLKKPRSIRTLALTIAGRMDPKFNELPTDERESRIKNLRRIFNNEKDRVLVRASTLMSSEGQHYQERLMAVLSQLKDLGILTPEKRRRS